MVVGLSGERQIQRFAQTLRERQPQRRLVRDPMLEADSIHHA